MDQDIPTVPIPLDDIRVGMNASYSQTIGDFEIKQFAGLSGDHNPVHLDQEYAEKSRFKKRIAHGMISVSFFPLCLAQNYLEKDVYMPVKTLILKDQFILVIQ